MQAFSPAVRDIFESFEFHIQIDRLDLGTASPKVWMDAYLAAFAVASGLRMVTLDGDFRNYTTRGLTLELIAP